HDGRRGYIYHTAVLPAFRQQGIAKALVQHTLDALNAEDIHKAALVVFKRNALGNAFWEKLGFSERDDLVYRNVSIHELERIDT
ncbi:MAG: GNAT family N-acetyltransferase, partial [Clostridia bacterium]|nr:GNAT family N-acetyltransferase [Clostridia bacterium]